MSSPNVVKLVGVDSKNGEIIAVYISHELSGYKGKFVPDRQHGEWKYEPTKGAFCSECGWHSIWNCNFCPECGADMREGDDSDRA